MALLLRQIAILIYFASLVYSGILKNDTLNYAYHKYVLGESKNLKESADRSVCEAVENSESPVFLPHPSECNKFYICDNGSPHLKQCQPGLHFNQKINTCDYPENAGCAEDLENKIDGRMVDDDTACPVIQDSSRPIFIPHPTDCKSFFICNGGTKISLACPSDLHFNPKKEVCDFPEYAQCDGNFEDPLEKPKGKSLDEKGSVSCPVETSDRPTLLSHPTACSKFYLCDHGKPVLKSCPPGLNFNEHLQACDYKENTICPKGMTKAMAGGHRSEFCPPIDGKMPIFFRHLTNCSVFYMCGNGFAQKFECPARLHFNVGKRVCDYERNAGCRSVNS